MLWLGLRNREIECFPDGDRVERVDDRILCLGYDGLVLASFPFDEVLVFTRNGDIAELLRQGLAETDQPRRAAGQ